MEDGDQKNMQFPVAGTTIATAIDGKGVLLTTAGRRVRLLFAVGLLALAIFNIKHGVHAWSKSRSDKDNHTVGHWGNATDSDTEPVTIAPCNVNLGQLLESANVHTDIDPMLLRQQHGCCGDSVCSLGENHINCAADCADGVVGNLIWIESGRHRRAGRNRNRHQRDDDDDDHDGDNLDERDDIVDAYDGHHHGDYRIKNGKHNEDEGHRGKKHFHFWGHLLLALLSFVISVLISWSIRKQIGSIMTDFKTFFWPNFRVCRPSEDLTTCDQVSTQKKVVPFASSAV